MAHGGGSKQVRTLTSSSSSDGSGAISRRRRRMTWRRKAANQRLEWMRGVLEVLVHSKLQRKRRKCVVKRTNLGIDDRIPVRLAVGAVELRQVPSAVHPSRVRELAIKRHRLQAPGREIAVSPEAVRALRRGARAPLARFGRATKLQPSGADGARAAGGGRTPCPRQPQWWRQRHPRPAPARASGCASEACAAAACT